MFEVKIDLSCTCMFISLSVCLSVCLPVSSLSVCYVCFCLNFYLCILSTSYSVLGCAYFRTVVRLFHQYLCVLPYGFRPSSEITCPTYVTCCRKNSHLSRRSFMPYSFGAERTCLRFCKCSSFIRPSGDDHVVQVHSHMRNARNQIVD